LTAILLSIAVNAVLGVYALVVPDFGDLQRNVLATSGCVTGAGILVFACLPAWEKRRLGPVPTAGMAASIVGFGLLVTGVWSGAESQPLQKSAGTALVVAGVAVLASMLALARLAQRYVRVVAAAWLLAAVLGSMIVSGMWGEWSSPLYGRAVGVVGVLLAAATIAVPILHLASRAELARGGETRAALRFCPACGRRIELADTGDVVCRSCGSRFRVSFLRS
jgi:hypothetical protein